LEFAKEADDQTVRQAYDLAGGAEAHIHADVVRAAGFGDGETAALDGDDIAASLGGGDGELLIRPQIHGAEKFAVAQDLSLDTGLPGGEEKGKPQASREQGGKQRRPKFTFHREITS